MKDKFEEATRPEIIEFFGKGATPEQVHKTYIGNPCLFKYAQALDEYIDELDTLHQQALKEVEKKMLKFAERCSEADYSYTSNSKIWFYETDERPDKTTEELFEKFNKSEL